MTTLQPALHPQKEVETAQCEAESTTGGEAQAALAVMVTVTLRISATDELTTDPHAATTFFLCQHSWYNVSADEIHL